MKKNKPGCAVPGGPTASDEFRKNLFLVRPLESAEKGNALQLAWRVFCEFESPVYAPEGTEEFKRCLNDDAYLSGIRYYGAFDADKLVGVLGIREEKCHVCFFFVEGEYEKNNNSYLSCGIAVCFACVRRHGSRQHWRRFHYHRHPSRRAKR